MEENFRFERIKKLLSELEYELARAYHEDDLPEGFEEGLAQCKIIGHMHNEPLEFIVMVKKQPFRNFYYNDGKFDKYNGLKLVK